MEKKYRRVDVNRKRATFFQIGLIIAISLCIMAFKLKFKAATTSYESDFIEPDPVFIAETFPAPAPKKKVPEVEPQKTEQKEKQPSFLDPIISNVEPTYAESPLENSDKVSAKTAEDVPFTNLDSLPEDDYLPEPIFMPDRKPKFPGGYEAMYKFLGKKIRFPREARRNDIEGTVYVNFIVERDGSISNVKILRGVGFGCDEEARRVVTSMPKWSPGIQNDVPVRVSFNLPISFKTR